MSPRKNKKFALKRSLPIPAGLELAFTLGSDALHMKTAENDPRCSSSLMPT